MEYIASHTYAKPSPIKIIFLSMTLATIIFLTPINLSLEVIEMSNIFEFPMLWLDGL